MARVMQNYAESRGCLTSIRVQDFHQILDKLTLMKDEVLGNYFIPKVGARFFVTAKKAFPGINGGEQECEVILCVVHIMRLWMSKIYDKKTQDVIVAAMHKRTKIGCEKLIQEAIDNCAISSIQNYIKRNYMKNMEHEIKRLTSSKHGLIGAVQNIVNIDLKKRSDSEKVAFEFRTKKISAYGVKNDIIEEIHKFLFPLQHLIVKEACAVMNKLEKGKGDIEEFSDIPQLEVLKANELPDVAEQLEVPIVSTSRTSETSNPSEPREEHLRKKAVELSKNPTEKDKLDSIAFWDRMETDSRMCGYAKEVEENLNEYIVKMLAVIDLPMP
ncbi:hypothetical protein RhiirA4_477030 [Rhizophagus irregularis]|uniref:Uncharacterized protein n=1 Tax=Rhizophagus irregularis TaxID=588596 RepID=A0A2I1HCR4_9GLOM|nr:hypothetical protein RhiirA4_477030 [Rhizophagus irregularis]